MTSEELKAMAEAHCDYTLSVYREGYLDAFIHGYKHGQEDKIANNTDNRRDG